MKIQTGDVLSKRSRQSLASLCGERSSSIPSCFSLYVIATSNALRTDFRFAFAEVEVELRDSLDSTVIDEVGKEERARSRKARGQVVVVGQTSDWY